MIMPGTPSSRSSSSIKMMMLISMMTLLLVIPSSSSSSFVSAVVFNANGVTLQLQNLNEAEIRFTSVIDSTVTIGPNVTTQSLDFGLFARSTMIIYDTTVDGSTFFTGIGSGSNITIHSSRFQNGAVRLGPSNGVDHFSFYSNQITIPATTTSANAALEFTAESNITNFEFRSNTIAFTSTATSGIRSCLTFSPTSVISKGSFAVTDNNCVITAVNPRGITTLTSAVQIDDSFTISGNTFTLTSNSAADGGVSICVSIENFVYITTGGFYYKNNMCTGRSNGVTQGVVLSSSTVTNQSPVYETLEFSGNTFDLVDSGADGTASAIEIGFILRRGYPNTTSVNLFSSNTITVQGNRAVTAFDFAKGVESFVGIGIFRNDVTLNAAAASATATDYSAVVRLAQQNTGFAAPEIRMDIFKNTFRLTGTYGPGFIAVGDGTGASSTKTVAGAWLFRTNTLTSVTTAALFSPTMDVSLAGGNLTMSCTTLNGASLPSAQVASSISGTLPTGYYQDFGCTTCSFDYFCQQDRTISAFYDTTAGECRCRCRTYRYQYDLLPSVNQCRYRPGDPFTFSKSRTHSHTELPITTTSTTTTTTEAPNVTDGRIFEDGGLSAGAIAGISVGALAFAALVTLLLLLCCCPVWFFLCCPCCRSCCPCFGKEDDDKDSDDLDNKNRGIEMEDSEEYDGNTIGDGEIIPKDPLALPVVNSYIDDRADREDSEEDYYDLVNGQGHLSMNSGGELAPNQPANRHFILAEPHEGEGSSPSPHEGGGHAATDVSTPPRRPANNNSNSDHNSENNKTSPRRIVSSHHANNDSKSRQRDAKESSVIEMTPNARMSPRG